MDEHFRNLCRSRVQEVNPEVDEVSFVKIMEEAQDMYQLRFFQDACRRRIQQKRPDLDEFGAHEIMRFTALPPILMVVSALAQRMHLSVEARKDQVAAMMALRCV
jgi:hypothetical protein